MLSLFFPRITERYLAREIYLASALVLAAFVALFSFFDMINELDDIGKGGYQFHQALLYVSLLAPGRIYELLPVAVLIGSLYSLTTLARHSELTVLRTSGLSTTAMLTTLVKIGSVFVLLILVLGEFVVPPAERTASRLRLEATSSLVAQEFRSGLWLKDEKSFVNIRQVQPNGELRNIRIYNFDNMARLSSIIAAEHGKFQQAGRWQITGVTLTNYAQAIAHTEKRPDDIWQTELSPDILAVLQVKPERMPLWTLHAYINHLQENHQKADAYQIALWKKLIYPLATLVMLALALPFAYAHSRNSAVNLKIFIGVMIGVTFHALNGLFSHLGIINAWPSYMAAATPSLLFMLTATTMLWWVERR